MKTTPSDIDELYWHALGLESESEREDYLREECRDLTPDKILKLIRAQAQAEQFWQQAAATAEQSATDASSIAEQPGQRIGPYLLQEQIGEGGMGVVFVALQTEPIKRRVAVKIVKPGMDTRQVVARFEAERQALALMEHPHIARVFDAGTTPGGRPYFVMELVRGIRITKFCELHDFSLQQRLQLFAQVCHAVQHAHQKGIIHRDLKPSNILVELHDVTVVPKIIDFGIAKAMSGANPGYTIYTGLHEVMGTPMYMSPEAAEFNALDIDTRSDVYALGVVLYELLTGQSPFDRQRLREASFSELFRIIREETPPRPSTRQSRIRNSKSEGAPAGPDLVQKRFHSELDWVVMKALEKDRKRRYQSATDLADDVQRFLDHQEVRARPPSIAYRCAKLFRRHRAAVIGIVGVFLALLTGLLATGWQANKAWQARRTADAKSVMAAAARDEALRLKGIAEQARQEALHQLFLADMRLASASLEAGDIPRVRSLLEAHRDTQVGGQKIAWRILNERTDVESLWQTAFVAPIQAMDLSPAEGLLAVGTRDSRVHLVDASTGDVRMSFTTYAECNGVAWHPNGQILVSAGADGCLRYWQLPSESALRPANAVLSVLSLAGLPAPLQPIRSLLLHDGEAKDCVFTPDGKLLLTCGDDAQIHVCKAATGTIVRTIRGHEREVERLAVSPDGTYVASASSDGTLHVYNLKTKKRQSSYRCSPHGARVVSVDFSSDSQLVAAGDIHGHILVADVTRGATARVHQIDGIESLCFDQDAQHLVSGDRGGTLRLWAIHRDGDKTLRLADAMRHWQGHDSYVQALQSSGPNGRMVSGGRDGRLSLWSGRSSKISWLHADAKVSQPVHDDQLITYGQEIYRVDLPTRTLKQAERPQSFLGRRYYSNRCPTHLILENPGQDVSLYDRSSELVVGKWRYPHEVSDAAASPDGRWLAVSEFEERRFVHVYRVGQSDVVHRLPVRQCSGMSFSHDSRRLAVSAMDDAVLFDLDSGDLIHRMRGHESTVEDFAFHPDDTLLASISDDRRLIVWDLESGRSIAKTRAHAGEMTGVDWSPDGRTIATCGRDYLVKLWDAVSLQPFLEYRLPGHGDQVSFSLSGQALLVRTRDDGLAFLGMPKWSDIDSRHAGGLAVASARKRHRGESFFTVVDEFESEQSCWEVRVSADGATLAGTVATPHGDTVFQWDRENRVRWPPNRVTGQPVRHPLFLWDSDQLLASTKVGAKQWGPFEWARPPQSALSAAVSASQDQWTSVVCRDGIVGESARLVGHGILSGSPSQRSAWVLEDGQLQRLPPVHNGHHACATCLTRAGHMIFGTTWTGSLTSRSPAARSLSVVRWKEGRPFAIPELQGAEYNWKLTDVSADGTVIVGDRWPVGQSPLHAEKDFRLGFRWEQGEVTLIGRVQPQGVHAALQAVSADGRVVVGHSETPRGPEAIIWDATHGLRTLQAVAEAAGVAIGGWHLKSATDISADGTVIVGLARGASGASRPFVLQLPGETLR